MDDQRPPFEPSHLSSTRLEEETILTNEDSPREVQEGKSRRLRKRKKTAFSKHQVRRSKFLKLALGILIVFLIFYLLPVPLGSIQVNGSKKISTQDVMVAGNIREPVNILQINTSRLKDRLSQDLRVENVNISYDFPLTMRIDITERQALAVVNAQFGFVTIDKNGQVIDTGTAIETTNVPIISGIKLGNVLLGDQVNNPTILKSLEFLSALTEDGLANIAEVNIGNENEIIAYTVDGLPIHLGDTSDLKKKAELSEDMIKDVEDKKISAQYIDANISAPFIKQ